MYIRSTVLATLAMVLFSSVNVSEAHSWADCVDWVPKNPAKPSFAANGGTCRGWARKYPWKSSTPFGKLDSSSPNRHYQQNPSDFTACSDGRHGDEPGADETRQNPISKAYGGNWGAQPTAFSGDTMCIRWPAKNHAVPSERENFVFLYMPPNLVTRDPTQSEFLKMQIARLPYKNCNHIPGDTDLTPCGGCFKVPERQPGNYVIQWRWELNPNEFYTSCWDLLIKAPVSGNSTVKTLGGGTSLFAELTEI